MSDGNVAIAMQIVVAASRVCRMDLYVLLTHLFRYLFSVVSA